MLTPFALSLAGEVPPPSHNSTNPLIPQYTRTPPPPHPTRGSADSLDSRRHGVVSKHRPAVRQATQCQRRPAVGQREQRHVTTAVGQQQPGGAGRPLPPPLPAAGREWTVREPGNASSAERTLAIHGKPMTGYQMRLITK